MQAKKVRAKRNFLWKFALKRGNNSIKTVEIYNTKGRDRFLGAATPLKPYKVGNICDITYKCSVLYFLNLSLKQSFFHRKRQFLRKYPNSDRVIVPETILSF